MDDNLSPEACGALYARIRAGEEDPDDHWKLRFHATRLLSHWLCRRVKLSAEERDDCGEGAFLTALARANQLTTWGQFVAYSKVITRREARRLLQRRRERVSLDSVDLEPVDPRSRDFIAEVEFRDLVQNILTQLEDRCEKVLFRSRVMAVCEGDRAVALDVLARELGVSPRTVDSRWKSLLEKLRVLVDRLRNRMGADSDKSSC